MKKLHHFYSLFTVWEHFPPILEKFFKLCIIVFVLQKPICDVIREESEGKNKNMLEYLPPTICVQHYVYLQLTLRRYVLLNSNKAGRGK